MNFRHKVSTTPLSRGFEGDKSSRHGFTLREREMDVLFCEICHLTFLVSSETLKGYTR